MNLSVKQEQFLLFERNILQEKSELKRPQFSDFGLALYIVPKTFFVAF